MGGYFAVSRLLFQSSHDLHQLKKSIAPSPGKYNIASATVSLQVVIGLCRRKETAALKIKTAVS